MSADSTRGHATCQRGKEGASASQTSPHRFIIITRKPPTSLNSSQACTRGSDLPDVHHLPRHDNEEIQSVPRVSKVALLAKNAQGHHLEHHFHGKEDEDEVIEDLQGRMKGQCEVREQDPGVRATV